MCLCSGTGSYRVSRFGSWLTRKGWFTGWQIVEKECDCGAKIPTEKAGEGA